jgi:hypothetical protein
MSRLLRYLAPLRLLYIVVGFVTGELARTTER